MIYRNPVLPGFHPDPSVCRVGNDYYLVTSTFEYFPGVPIFHSVDLVHWEQIGHCLTRESQLPLAGAHSSGGIFAPTIRWHAGTFYMVVTNVSSMGHFYVTATQPEGPWSEPILIRDIGQPVAGIDPSLFFDDDGLVYFSSTAGLATIDIKTGTLTSEVRSVWGGSGGRYSEAPHLYKINGMYYYMQAEGGTEPGHMETIARSGSPWGPYDACPHNPILSHRDRGGHPIQSVGHADLVHAHDNTWWAIFLGTRVSVKYPHVHHLGRETFLAPVTWDADGWPIIGSESGVELEMQGPSFLANTDNDPKTLRDDFDSKDLAISWNFRRNPDPALWSLMDHPGSLTLKCAPGTLSDVVSIAFVGRRQQHLGCHFSASLAFDPGSAMDEAGLTVIMNEEHHYEIYVRGNDHGNRTVAVRRQIGDLAAIVAEENIIDGNVILSISSDADNYHFSYTSQDRSEKLLTSASTRYLATEVAGGFTGVYLGMYATSNHLESTASAQFDWTQYTAD